MSRGFVSSEGINARSFPCINGSGAEISRGRPLMRDGRADWKGEVVYGKGAAGLGEFAGILSADLEYNGVADVSSSKLKREGRVLATVYVHATPAKYVKGAHLVPAYTTALGAHLTQVDYNTGIVLLDDWTGKTAATLYKVESGAGARVFITDAVSHAQTPLHYMWLGVLAADVDAIATATATSTAVTTLISTGASWVSGAADYARNVTVTPGGTTADVGAGDIVVTGTNIDGEAITESIAIAANASTAVVGNKAFQTVTSVVFPAQDGAGATYTVGWGVKLGLGRCFPDEPLVMQARAAGTVESTAPTLAVNVAAVESNTISFDTAPAANNLEAYLVAA